MRKRRSGIFTELNRYKNFQKWEILHKNDSESTGPEKGPMVMIEKKS